MSSQAENGETIGGTESSTPPSRFPPPKYIRDTLDKVSGVFIYQNPVTHKYEYYYAKLDRERVGNYVRIIRAPEFVPEGDGYMVFSRKLYKVTLRDFFRSRVNVGVGPYSISGDSTASRVSGPSAESVTNDSTGMGTTGSNQVKSGTLNNSQCEESKEADLVWEEQIRALLHLEDPEAQWDGL